MSFYFTDYYFSKKKKPLFKITFHSVTRYRLCIYIYNMSIDKFSICNRENRWILFHVSLHTRTRKEKTQVRQFGIGRVQMTTLYRDFLQRTDKKKKTKNKTIAIRLVFYLFIYPRCSVRFGNKISTRRKSRVFIQCVIAVGRGAINSTAKSNEQILFR